MANCGWNGYEFDKGKLLIFAKTPKAGKVKTRMQPVLSEQESALLHHQLLSHCLAQMDSGNLVEAELWVSDVDYDWQQFSYPLELQSGDDLGQRMLHAASQTLKNSDSVVIIGADCPFIDRKYVRMAFEALAEGHDCVIGPAVDGGYVLIALARVDEAIFTGIDWGSEQVLTQTLQQLGVLGWTYKTLPVLNDIDRPEDLSTLKNLPVLKHWLSYGQ
jgi:rSAM/selenodomain-associated transferase 1